VILSQSVCAPVPVTRHYETVVCDVCGTAGGTVLARIPAPVAIADPLQRFCVETLEFPRSGIALVLCPACGFGYQDPRLSQVGMQAFYARFYDPAGPSGAYHRTAQPELERARYEAITAAGHTSGSVLDVGAGKGYALEAFPPSSWKRHGLDVSSEALATLRARLPDAAVIEGSLSQVDLPDGAFDVVTMNSTLEHLRDPIDTLLAARRILKPGGLLVFNVPNLDSASRFLADRTGGGWFGFTPEHLNYFTPKVLTRIAHDVGFSGQRHHTVGFERTRGRWGHLGQQFVRIGSGLKRLALGGPEARQRLTAGFSVVADWPFSSTPLGRRLHYGENITGFWTA